MTTCINLFSAVSGEVLTTCINLFSAELSPEGCLQRVLTC